MIGKITTLLFGFLLLGVMFGGIFHVSHELSMNDASGGCSFMSPTESVCSMSALDHLAAWKDVFTTVIPAVFILGTLLALAIILIATPPHILKRNAYRLPQLFRYHYTQHYTFPHRPLQELFASGILHPKLH